MDKKVIPEIEEQKLRRHREEVAEFGKMIGLFQERVVNKVEMLEDGRFFVSETTVPASPANCIHLDFTFFDE